MAREQLFPQIEPYETGKLDLDGLHTMYWEECGNPDGAPVVFLHGGPGAGATPAHRRFFDPRHYRIIIYDQRGAGRSEPSGELTDNTTQLLIADLETLRARCAVDKWLMCGGSWGSTLALAYGETYPERCSGFILRGIFLGRRQEVEWFLYGMKAIFPENWHDFVEQLDEDERGDILESFYRRLMDPDESVHAPAAQAWSRYEGACSTLLPSPGTVAAFSGAPVARAVARIESHYFRNNMFLEPDCLLDGIDRVRELPCVIVQGRFDMVCPITNAYELHKVWPTAEFVIVPDAGHSAMEPGIRAALVRAAEDFKRIL